MVGFRLTCLDPGRPITSENLPPAKRNVNLCFPLVIVPPAVKPPVAIRLATPEPGLVVMAVNVSVLVVEVAVAMFATASVAAAAVTVAAMIILRICVRSLVDRMRLLLFI